MFNFNVVPIVLYVLYPHLYFAQKRRFFQDFNSSVTYRPTDGWTDTPSDRDARTHLKIDTAGTGRERKHWPVDPWTENPNEEKKGEIFPFKLMAVFKLGIMISEQD